MTVGIEICDLLQYNKNIITPAEIAVRKTFKKDRYHRVEWGQTGELRFDQK